MGFRFFLLHDLSQNTVLVVLLRLLLLRLVLGRLAVLRHLLLVVLHGRLHLLQPLFLQRPQLLLGDRFFPSQVLQILLADVSSLDLGLEPLILFLQLSDQLVSRVLIDDSLSLNLLCSVS